MAEKVERGACTMGTRDLRPFHSILFDSFAGYDMCISRTVRPFAYIAGPPGLES